MMLLLLSDSIFVSSPVCVHVCMCILHVTFTMLTCGDQRPALGVFLRHYLTLLYETQLRSWYGIHLLSASDWLASHRGLSARLCLLSWDYKHTPPCLTFYTGTGELNLCLHACSLSILPAESSPQPWDSIFCTMRYWHKHCIPNTLSPQASVVFLFILEKHGSLLNTHMPNSATDCK